MLTIAGGLHRLRPPYLSLKGALEPFVSFVFALDAVHSRASWHPMSRGNSADEQAEFWSKWIKPVKQIGTDVQLAYSFERLLASLPADPQNAGLRARIQQRAPPPN